MKNILLLVFTFLSITIFAQSNEVIVSYQSFRPDPKLGIWEPPSRKGIALNFYRNMNTKSAIAVKINANQYRQSGFTTRFRSLGLDVTSRRTLLQKYNIRVMGEFGISVLRDYSELVDMDELYEDLIRNHAENGGWLCGVIDVPQNSKMTTDYPREKWFKSNHYGLASSLSIDYTIKNRVIIGLSYGYNVYWTTNEAIEDKKTRRLNLNLNLGYKF